MTEKTMAIETFNRDNHTMRQALVKKLRIPSEYISFRSNIKMSRIILKSGCFITRYYAIKKTAEIAETFFNLYDGIKHLHIEIPYSNGVVLASVQRDAFYGYWNAKKYEKETHIPSRQRKTHKKRAFMQYAKVFTEDRICRFIKPGSRFEALWAKLTANKAWINKIKKRAA